MPSLYANIGWVSTLTIGTARPLCLGLKASYRPPFMPGNITGTFHFFWNITDLLVKFVCQILLVLTLEIYHQCRFLDLADGCKLFNSHVENFLSNPALMECLKKFHVQTACKEELDRSRASFCRKKQPSSLHPW